MRLRVLQGLRHNMKQEILNIFTNVVKQLRMHAFPIQVAFKSDERLIRTPKLSKILLYIYKSPWYQFHLTETSHIGFSKVSELTVEFLEKSINLGKVISYSTEFGKVYTEFSLSNLQPVCNFILKKI